MMHSGTRTAAILWLGALTLLGSAAPPVQAQSYPARPMRFLVGGPPGSGADLVSRMLAPKLAERLGQPVVVEQKTGAGGIIANEALSKSPPDGHTLAPPSTGIAGHALFDPSQAVEAVAG